MNVKWGVVFKNWKMMKGLTAQEKEFAWKNTQDMLPVGSRIHRKNAERKCLANLENGNICSEVQTLEHAFKSCPLVVESYENIISVLNSFIGRNVTYNDLIHLSMNHRKKSKLLCALWFSVKMMYNIFYKKMFNNSQFKKN